MMINVRFILIDLESREFKMDIKPVKEFVKSFKLPNEFTWDIGIDQSTSCTGVGAIDLENKKLFCCEVSNEGIANQYYVSALKNFFKAFIPKGKVRYLVMEEPLPFISGNQNHVLVELKRTLSDFFKNSNFGYKKFDLVKPQSWRSGLIKKDNPNDKRSKMASVYEIEKMFDLMKEFRKVTYHPTNSSGYDGFEGLGIILGYRKRFSITNGDELVKIVGPLNTKKVAVSFFCYCNRKNNRLGKVIELVKMCNIKLDNPVIKIYNEEHNVYGNSKMSLVDDFTVTVITNPLDVLSILHMFGIVPRADEKNLMYMVTVPKSFLKDDHLEYLRSKGLKFDVFY